MAAEKVALVTAGGSGMGAGAARRLAADGFRVAILSSSGKGEALAAELGGLGVTSRVGRITFSRYVSRPVCHCSSVISVIGARGP